MVKLTKDEIDKQTESIANSVKNIFSENKSSPPISLPIGYLLPKIIHIRYVYTRVVETGLLTEEEVDFEPIYCNLIGFLVKETDKAYYLAKEYWDSGQYKYIHIIPKNTAIVKITTLQT